MTAEENKNAERELQQLENAIQELRIEFERFFNGAIQVPPEDLKKQIQRRIRRLRNSNLKGAAEQFRLGNLESRFNSFNERFNRRLRDHEEGRGARPAVGQESPQYDLQRGVVLDEAAESNAVEALYTGLQSRSGRSQRFDLDSFRTYLKRQVSSLRKKTGCQKVQFRLSEENGEVKLKAKPLRTESSGA